MSIRGLTPKYYTFVCYFEDKTENIPTVIARTPETAAKKILTVFDTKPYAAYYFEQSWFSKLAMLFIPYITIRSKGEWKEIRFDG